MTKEERAALITSLVGDKHSGFTTGDEKMLEAASDERLDGFRTAAATRKTTEEESANKIKALEKKEFTEEEWRKGAPASVRSLIARQEASDTAHKTDLVTTLKDAQSEYSEDELKAMEIEPLERLARIAKVQQPEAVQVTYAGRPIPRVAAKKDELTTPPNPYDEPLKALRAKEGLPPITPPTVQ